MTPITAPPPTTAVPDSTAALPGQAPVQQPATGLRPGGRGPFAQRQPARQSEPGAALRGESTADRLRLPGASNGERALPNVRR